MLAAIGMAAGGNGHHGTRRSENDPGRPPNRPGGAPLGKYERYSNSPQTGLTGIKSREETVQCLDRRSSDGRQDEDSCGGTDDGQNSNADAVIGGIVLSIVAKRVIVTVVTHGVPGCLQVVSPHRPQAVRWIVNQVIGKSQGEEMKSPSGKPIKKRYIGNTTRMRMAVCFISALTRQL